MVMRVAQAERLEGQVEDLERARPGDLEWAMLEGARRADPVVEGQRVAAGEVRARVERPVIIRAATSPAISFILL